MKSIIAGVFTPVRRNVFSLLVLASLAACGGGGGGGGGGEKTPPARITINGGGVKGPMANATVTVYALDTTNVAGGFKGAEIDSGTTNDAAQIVGLSISRSNTPPFILEFTSTAETYDITTCDTATPPNCSAPVIGTLRTVLTQELIDSGDPLYATPQTTMATDIAIARADSNVPPYTGNNDGVTTGEELLNALPVAAAQVMGTLGFGASTSVNIWDTPPIVDGTTTDAASQQLVAEYRTAVEALTALAAHLGTLATPTVTAQEMFDALTADLADDGVINGSSGAPPIDGNVLAALTSDPATLFIPNSAPPRPLSDIEQLLVSERAITGFENVDTTALNGEVFNPSPAQESTSEDGDDIPDSIDLCPGFNSNNNNDTNNNGVGDACELVAPTAVNDDAGAVDEGGTLNGASVLANDTDPEGDSLTATVDTGPAHASSFTLNPDGTFTYVHDGNESTSDSFTYTATDGWLTSAPATVSITINPQNDAPEAVADSGYEVLEGGVLTITEAAFGVLLNDIDVEGDPLTAVLNDNVSNGSLTLNSDGTFTYSHNGSETTSDSFTYHANDGELDSNIVTVSITVTPQNDIPVANDDSITVNEGGTATTLVGGAASVRDNDTDVETATASLTVDTPQITGPSNGSLTLLPDGTFSYTHNGSETTTDSFTYTVSDGTDSSLPATVSISINPQNDAPVANADSIQVDEGGTATTLVGGASSVRDNDTDAETATESLTVAQVTGPTHAASFTLNSDGTFSYTHDGGETLSDSFTYRVNDGTTNSTPAVVTITINPQNDPPVAVNDSASVVTGGTVIINVRDNDTDAETATSSLTVTLGTAPTNGSFVLNGDNTITYTHNGVGTAPDSFTYTVSDGSLTSDPATVSITVTANQSPTAGVDSITVNEGGTATILVGGETSVLANDSDPESNPLTAELDTDVTHGTLTLNGDGTFSYTHDGTETTSDSFTYHANDGFTDSNIVTVSITVNPMNDPPVAVDDSMVVSNGGTRAVLVGGSSSVRDNDSDVESATSSLTVALVTGPANASSFTLNDDGTFSYTHDGTATTSDSFTYTVSDGEDVSEPATVSISILTTPPFNISGTYFVESTVAGQSGSGCRPVPEPTNRRGAFTVSQSETVDQNGQAVITSIRTVEGAQLGGDIDTLTGDFSLTTGTYSVTEADLTLPGDDTATVTSSSDLSVLDGTTTGTPGNYVLSGNLIRLEDYDSDSTIDCTIVENFTASFAYRHTTTENYDGVYAMEADGYFRSQFDGGAFDQGSTRSAFPLEFEIVDSSLTVHGPPNMNGTDQISGVEFDPATGFFRFTVTATDWYGDPDGAGPLPAEETSIGTNRFSGIFMRNPDTDPGADGQPLVVMFNTNIDRNYTGDSRAETPVAFRAENSYARIYGKRLVTEAYTRTKIKQNGNQTLGNEIVVGLKNPSWRISDPASRLWLEVLSGGTQLCLVPYIDSIPGDGSGQYTEQLVLPDPPIFDSGDGVTPLYLFRGNTYSRITCNTSLDDGTDRVADGDTLTVRVIDTGSDGLLDADGGTVADTYVYNNPYPANVVDPADRYEQTFDVSDIQVNGGTSSSTLAGNPVPLWGYFNIERLNTVTWPAMPNPHISSPDPINPDNYQIRLVNLDEPQPVEFRYVTSGTANTRAIDPGVLGIRSSLQMVAVNRIGETGPSNLAYSRKLELRHGIRGLFNIELGDNVPLQYRTMQVYLSGVWGPTLSSCDVNNNINVSCNPASSHVNYGYYDDTDRVTLTMTDETGDLAGGVGSTFTLTLDFGATLRSDRAVVTSDLGSITNASARVANTEVLVRSRRYSNGDIESQALVLNPRTRNGLYDRAVFLLDDAIDPAAGNLMVNGVDTGSASAFLWDGNTLFEYFSDVVRSFIGLPLTDGVPQQAGRYVAKASSDDWGLHTPPGLFDPARYKFVLRNIADPLAEREIHRYDYAAPDPSSYVAPTIDQVVVVLPASTDVPCVVYPGDCNPTWDVDVSGDANTFNLRWTVPTPPPGSRWQLFFNDETTGLQGRTARMIPNDPAIPGSGQIVATDNGDGTMTYEWLNNGTIGLESGQYVSVRFRVTNDVPGPVGFTAFGVSDSLDMVYLMLP